MRFRLAFWHRGYPGAQPGDVVDVPDHEVNALVRAGIGHPIEGTEQSPPAQEYTEPAAAEPAEQPE